MTVRGLRSQYARLMGRVFVPREIFLRSCSRVRYLRFSPRLQMVVAAFILAAGGWVAYTHISYLAYSATVASLGDAEEQTARLEGERAALESRIGDLRHYFGNLRDAHMAILTRLSERTRVAIELMEGTVRMAGLDVDALIGRAQEPESGQGGPFMPLQPVAVEPDMLLEGPAAVLNHQIDRWSALHQVARSLPLAAPLTQFSVTSRYGPRKDPINGRDAMHYGLDLGAPMRTSVFSTAPGQVVFAGTNGRYGRMVEIDHGFGIRTRYGHLHKILVKRGQVVAHHEKIGLLGSSGRSSGPHVHYEIHVDGKPHDPMNFLKAGRYVFKD